MRSHRALLLGLALAVLVVAAAGLSGTTRFAGPRWVPNLKLSHGTAPQRTVREPPSATGKRLPLRRATDSYDIGPILLWIVIAIVLVVALALLWRLWAARRSGAARTRRSIAAVAPVSEVPREPEPEPDPPMLRTGVELALQVLDEQHDPADAVVRAWLGLQESAEQSGIVRLPAETPTEFTSRILSHAFADDRAVRTLLRLYLRTRFGDHPVTDDDVAVVREALRELVKTWPTTTAGAGRR